VEAAWSIVRERGLAALAIRDLAKQVGITTPTVYNYFESKNAIYDAMFGGAAAEFAETMSQPYDSSGPREVLSGGVRRFVEFCTDDVTRYQLLFQRTIPDFEPTADALAPAVSALDSAREQLALNGVSDPRHLDMWTAWTTGLVDQQLSNDPGGDRWSRLIDEFVTMFLDYCHHTKESS